MGVVAKFTARLGLTGVVLYKKISLFFEFGARSSGGERLLDTQEVAGSNPAVLTTHYWRLWKKFE